MSWIPLPVGVENFEDLRRNGYYFVDKTLFERIFLSVRKVQNTVGQLFHTLVNIPIYIMTSEFNRDAISAILKKHNYYQLAESQFVLFTQGSLPCMDQNAHFVMQQKHKVREAFALHVDRSLSRRKRRLLFCNSPPAPAGRVEGEGHRVHPCVWRGQRDGAGRRVWSQRDA